MTQSGAARRRAHAAAYVLLALGLGGCSWLVNPEKDAPRCSVDGGHDPCPEGTSCVAGHCQQVSCGTREICSDGIDNDCDGDIDEKSDLEEMCNHADDNCDGTVDEGHDRDGDMFTWCGDLKDPGTRDCDDINPGVHPGAPESCDGVDNNCNGLFDEPQDGKSLCANGMLCLAGACVVPSCSIEGSGVTCPPDKSCVKGECVDRHCSETMCPTGSYCDMASGNCAQPPTPVEPHKNGEGCAVDDDCKWGLCVDAATMRLTGEPRRLCTKACCTDANCDAGESCFASGTGARLCLPRTLAKADKQCSLNEDCKTTERCALGLVPASEARMAFGAALCRTPALEDRQFGEGCTTSDACGSKLCVPDPLSIFGVCSMPCRESTDCTGLDERRGLTWVPSSLGAPHEYCRYVDLSQLGGPPYADDWGAVCVMDYETGGKKFGEACEAGRECEDGVCVAGGPDKKSYCTPTCCTDAQCAGIGTGHDGARCVPMARGGHYEMRCRP